MNRRTFLLGSVSTLAVVVALGPIFGNWLTDQPSKGWTTWVDSNATEAEEKKGRTIYVDINATGAEDGTSAANAYTSMADALDDVMNGDAIYFPTTPRPSPQRGAKDDPNMAMRAMGRATCA